VKLLLRRCNRQQSSQREIQRRLEARSKKKEDTNRNITVEELKIILYVCEEHLPAVAEMR